MGRDHPDANENDVRDDARATTYSVCCHLHILKALSLEHRSILKIWQIFQFFIFTNPLI